MRKVKVRLRAYSDALGATARQPSQETDSPAYPSLVLAELACLAVARRSRAKAGWEAGIRTPITCSRGTRPTVGRPPNLVFRGERNVDYSGGFAMTASGGGFAFPPPDGRKTAVLRR